MAAGVRLIAVQPIRVRGRTVMPGQPLEVAVDRATWLLERGYVRRAAEPAASRAQTRPRKRSSRSSRSRRGEG